MRMTTSEAMALIKSKVDCRDFLERDNAGKGFVCPFCGSGTGKHGTGALKVDAENRFHCYSCGKSGDVVDIYMCRTGCSFLSALRELGQHIGIEVQGSDLSQHDTGTPTASAPIPPTKEEDFTPYYRKCAIMLEQSPEAKKYIEGRGISLETVRRFGVGYDRAADVALAAGSLEEHDPRKQYPTKRLIFPTSAAHFVARSVEKNTPPNLKALNPKNAPIEFFNAGALYTQSKAFIVEGVFDCLSLAEVGASAVALNSVSNADKLLKRLEAQRPTATPILALDNDPAGRDATIKLEDGLRKLDIPYSVADLSLCGNCKDANEALLYDKQAFVDAVQIAETFDPIQPDNLESYIRGKMRSDVKQASQLIPTGFSTLDQKSGGGFTAGGLYALAALPSLGKTSLALQIGNQVAASGRKVLFFSLEMSKLELTAKSIARASVAIMTDGKPDFTRAVSASEIRRSTFDECGAEAINKYLATSAKNISVIEGNFLFSVDEVRRYTASFITRTGAQPLVIIDYLQLLLPPEKAQKKTTKEAIDVTITELKRMARDLNIPILAISSVNRASYLSLISFNSLKESGSIEFSSDVVWGLSLQCVAAADFQKKTDTEKHTLVNEAKNANPRKLTLQCLKNRFGRSCFEINFKYYAGNELFLECAEEQTKGFVKF